MLVNYLYHITYGGIILSIFLFMLLFISIDLMFRTLVKKVDERNRDDILEELMQGKVSKALNIPKNVTWGAQSSRTFRSLHGDFMKPAIHMGELII